MWSSAARPPVLTAEQARELLDSIDISTLVGLRDRALIAVMTYAFARIGAVVGMRVEDYYPKGKRWWVPPWCMNRLPVAAPSGFGIKRSGRRLACRALSSD